MIYKSQNVTVFMWLNEYILKPHDRMLCFVTQSSRPAGHIERRRHLVQVLVHGPHHRPNTTAQRCSGDDERATSNALQLLRMGLGKRNETGSGSFASERGASSSLSTGTEVRGNSDAAECTGFDARLWARHGCPIGSVPFGLVRFFPNHPD
jgi:hypothetical protein